MIKAFGTLGASIVFIHVEGSLLEALFSMNPKEGSQNAIKEIHERFPTVFLQTSLLGPTAIKKWLKNSEFIELPVIGWRKGAVFDEIAERGLRIKAIIAAPKVIESAREHAPLAFSFEAVEEAEKVKDWGEISDKLK